MKGYYNPMPILIPIIMRESMRNSTPITDVPILIQILLIVSLAIVALIIIGFLIELIKSWLDW